MGRNCKSRATDLRAGPVNGPVHVEQRLGLAQAHSLRPGGTLEVRTALTCRKGHRVRGQGSTGRLSWWGPALPVGSNRDWMLRSWGRPTGPSCSTNSEDDSVNHTTPCVLKNTRTHTHTHRNKHVMTPKTFCRLFLLPAGSEQRKGSNRKNKDLPPCSGLLHLPHTHTHTGE